MASPQITIVTGPIDSGKTSWCRKLVANDPGIVGLLLLKVYHRGARIGYDAQHLPGGEPIPFARVRGEEPPGWTPGERIGCFSLSEAALRAANDRLSRAAKEPADVIIDEVGPLELAGGGLSRGVRAVLAAPLRRKVYLVVRRACLPEVCDRFGIQVYSVVEIGADATESLKRD